MGNECVLSYEKQALVSAPFTLAFYKKLASLFKTRELASFLFVSSKLGYLVKKGQLAHLWLERYLQITIINRS